MARKLKKKQKGGAKDKDVYKQVVNAPYDDYGPVNESTVGRAIRKVGSKILGVDDWMMGAQKDKRYFTDKANRLAKKKPTKRRTKRILKLREKAENVKYKGQEITEFQTGGKKTKKTKKTKMMGGGMKKMYKEGGFLEPKTPNLDDL